MQVKGNRPRLSLERGRSTNCLGKQCYDHEELEQPRSFFLHDLDYLPQGFRAYPACPGERMIKHID